MENIINIEKDDERYYMNNDEDTDKAIKILTQIPNQKFKYNGKCFWLSNYQQQALKILGVKFTKVPQGLEL